MQTNAVIMSMGRHTTRIRDDCRTNRYLKTITSHLSTWSGTHDTLIPVCASLNTQRATLVLIRHDGPSVYIANTIV